MSKQSNTKYRTFDLPGYGRVSAPAHMTEQELLAAMQAADDDDSADQATARR